MTSEVLIDGVPATVQITREYQYAWCSGCGAERWAGRVKGEEWSERSTPHHPDCQTSWPELAE